MRAIQQRAWLNSGHAARVSSRKIDHGTVRWLEEIGCGPELVGIAERQANINLARKFSWLPLPCIRQAALRH